VKTQTIIKAVTAEDKALCYAIRFEVFIDEQKVPVDRERDEADEYCDHYLLRKDKNAIATARVQYKKNIAYIERVAVRKPFRKHGVGHVLMQHVIAELKGVKGLRAIEVGSQTQATEFYERLGFARYGEVYDDAGIPHVHMRLQAPTTGNA
jgi:predicted GNAT family N-acyltransferase